MRERLEKEEGFTLIELMVVVLIIAILVAIAIPSFLGFRSRAQDRAVQAELRNVLLAEKGVWVDNTSFTTVEADLKAFESSIILDDSSTSTVEEGVVVAMSVSSNDDVVCLTRTSDSGSIFAIFEDSSATGGTFYNAVASGTTLACPTAAGAPTGWVTGGFPTP
ncbi:MAG TPA: prepilin-type N-terminal cleavage/methylation domain-containing protein [Actinobacteria bacterium]|nr:prepilin-type N-terminal cleavage/methylation domain-containing protein [Actinomycetota bacterium]